jgi:ligand-binding sensor domain-containing protein/AraC-like DNA-binding protein
MRTRKGFPVLAACLFVFLAVPMSALDADRRLSQYICQTWRVEDGLPFAMINDIAQTPEGYIWLASEGGLIRFDGLRFTVFNNLNSAAFKENDVGSLLVDKEGALWIGLTKFGGLIRYKEDKFTSYSCPQGLSDPAITSLLCDDKGTIWIGTWNGLNRWEKGKFLRPYGKRDGLASENVYSLFEDHRGSIWVGTWGGGISHLENGRFRNFDQKDGLASNVVWSIFEDRERNLWVLTPAGLHLFHERSKRFTVLTTADGLAHNHVRSMLQDRNGNLWIGTWGGVHRKKGDRMSLFSLRDGLAGNIVKCLFEDREGNLWIGCWGGLTQLRNGKFVTFSKKEGLSSDVVKSVFCDRQGAIWVGTTESGLNRMRAGAVTSYSTKNGLFHDQITTIAEDRNGDLWIGTVGGVTRLRDGKVFARYQNDQRHAADYVRVIFQDRGGCFWVATEKNELTCRDARTFQRRRLPAVFGKIRVNAILQDRKGDMWFGTDAGVRLLAYGRVTSLTGKNGFTDHAVNVIHEDGGGILWFGTDDGLFRYLDGRLTRFTMQNGLPDNTIYQVFEDGLGFFWLGGPTGIIRVKRRQLEAIAAGKNEIIAVDHYGINDGMRYKGSSTYNQPAGCQSADGKMWFPTLAGLVMADPRNLPTNAVVPPVAIEGLRLDDRLIPLGSVKKFPKGTKKIEFLVNALSFADPARVRFRYRLDNFHQEWQADPDVDRERKVVFYGIPPGKYIFRIIACNNDGVWNRQGAAFSFQISAPLFQSPWFVAGLSGLVLLVGVGLFLTIRIRRYPYRTSTLKAEMADGYYQDLLTIMDQQKPFVDPDMTLSCLAARMALPAKHLSQVINEKSKKNFNEFINYYRIEEAKQILSSTKSKDIKLIRLAFEVGFNNKTTFNHMFKKSTGETPSEYRKNNCQEV